MRNFLETLLEGACGANTDDVEVSKDVEKEIEESNLPIGTLIECVTSNGTIGINAALEAYEMACIVGGVSVVSEGLGTEGASTLLEGAVKDFFKKIVEQIKKIKDWFVGMVKKIVSKFTSIGGDVTAKYEKYKSDFDKNFEDGKFTFKGKILDFENGSRTANNITGCIDDILDELVEIKLEGNDKDDIKSIVDAAKSGKTKNIWEGLSDVIGEKVENANDVIALIKKKYGASDDIESKDIKVSSNDVAVMRQVIEASSKDVKKIAKSSIDTVNAKCNIAIKVVKEAEKEAGENTDAVKVIQEAVSELNMLSGLYAQVINTQLGIFASASKAYVEFISQVAKGKAVEESTDFSHLFEEMDMDSIEDDDDEEGACGGSSKSEGDEETAATENQDLVNLAYSFLS